MAGIDNTIIFSSGERLTESTSTDIIRMQETADSVSRINYEGDPEGVISANPSSLCHDPVSGNLYIKQTGTGNTGWTQIPSGGVITSLTPRTGGSISTPDIPIEGQTAFTTSPSQVLDTFNDAGILKIVNNAFLSAYVVDPSTTPGLEGTFQTIQSAIDSAVANGATTLNNLIQAIWIRPGTYNENIVIPADACISLKAQTVSAPFDITIPDCTIIGNFTYAANANATTVFENITFQSSSGNAVALTDACGICFFKNCAFLPAFGANGIAITGANKVVRVYGCAFYGLNSDSSSPSESDCRFYNCVFLINNTTLSNNAIWTIQNCNFRKFICNDTSSISIFGGIQAGVALPYISGNTTGPVVVIGVETLQGGGSPLIDTAGSMYASNLSTKQANESTAMSPIFGNSGTSKMIPTLSGNILNSKQVATDYIMLFCDTYVGVTDTSSARTISLPTNGVPNAQYIVKDESLAAETNNITVDVNGATGTIDGAASIPITSNGGSLTFKSDNSGVNYFTI